MLDECVAPSRPNVIVRLPRSRCHSPGHLLARHPRAPSAQPQQRRPAPLRAAGASGTRCGGAREEVRSSTDHCVQATASPLLGCSSQQHPPGQAPARQQSRTARCRDACLPGLTGVAAQGDAGNDALVSWCMDSAWRGPSSRGRRGTLVQGLVAAVSQSAAAGAGRLPGGCSRGEDSWKSTSVPPIVGRCTLSTPFTHARAQLHGTPPGDSAPVAPDVCSTCNSFGSIGRSPA
jgi:hypothetical protein